MAGVGIIRRSVHEFSRYFIPGSQFLVRRSYTKDQNEGVSEATSQQEEMHTLTTSDTPLTSDKLGDNYTGAAQSAFPQQVCDTLMSPVNENDVEIKPDGLLYLPEIKYRRILNQSFGPGGWALMPKGDSLQFQSERDNSQLIVREYALFCLGRFVAQTVGEHTFYSNDSNMVYGKAMESAKSNALMRCCKDLGVASELWDPQFIIKWKEEFAVSVWCENARTKERKKMWRRKDRKPTDAFFYPWKEVA